MATGELYRNAANNQILLRDTKLIRDGATSLGIDFLIIAGGGGTTDAATFYGGGGGAGGYIYNTGLTINVGTYPIVIGNGGVKVNGDDSTFSGYTAIGGGAGRERNTAGNNGGCGGGAGMPNAGTLAGGTGSQGFNGGSTNIGLSTRGAGGGGIGAVGGDNAGSNTAGSGGNGLIFSIFTGTTFGGGGEGSDGNNATPGIGGGGSSGASPTNGTPNTGGGGGGVGGSQTGKNGGSGIAMFRFLTSDLSDFTITGGSSSINGSYTIITFTTSSNLVIT